MTDSLTFRTRARTIDHLGREQIADAPTAVSELWKNAYDAYARNVALHIFEEKEFPIAAIVDDGHGMNRQEIEDLWFVVGTESKIGQAKSSKEDRNGLSVRERQGQKGIGRLSSASLGPLLLMISKRKDEPFVASLIDWRIFENPYLYLEDIRIPIVDFDDPEEFAGKLSAMSDTLIGNAWGEQSDKKRSARLKDGWNQFDELEKEERKLSTKEESKLSTQEERKPLTKESIEKLATEVEFTERHLNCWPVWNGSAESGTALFIADIAYDLESQFNADGNADDAAKHARKRLTQTLSHFTDSYVNEKEADLGYAAAHFNYSVQMWRKNEPESKIILDQNTVMSLDEFLDLEYIVDGRVDAKGVFRGRIKAFGEWLPGTVTLKTNNLPTGPSTRPGPFSLRFGTYELESTKSSLSGEQHKFFNDKDKTDFHGALKVYRDGLRVLPFGRIDNDFFEIEERRNKHAGREFWAARRMFGRIALKRSDNPNLKDKAGREGLIDNRAVKAFRDIVVSILKESARRYFGTDASEFSRKDKIGDNKRLHREKKAEEARKRFINQRREAFGLQIAASISKLVEVVTELEQINEKINADGPPGAAREAVDMHGSILRARRRVSTAEVGDPPNNLGRFENEYKEYLDTRKRANALAAKADKQVVAAFKKLPAEACLEAVRNAVNQHETSIRKQVRAWTKKISAGLQAEIDKIKEISSERSEGLRADVSHFMDDAKAGRMPLDDILRQIDAVRKKMVVENEDFYTPYISALEALGASVDIAYETSFRTDEVSELRSEVERLNELAQTGITVEIISHEFESLDEQIRKGLKALSAEFHDRKEFERVSDAHEQLARKLRFLSPLSLSGDRLRQTITGEDIFSYCRDFMGEILHDAEIKLDCSAAFRAFQVTEDRAMIFPVFINLINNAQYWIRSAKSADRRIMLDVSGERVVVADTGPGVDDEDIRHLFTLFFTRKIRGGRGVGLYICRMNLAAGGHSIEYIAEDAQKILSGANFAVKFRGGQYV